MRRCGWQVLQGTALEDAAKEAAQEAGPGPQSDRRSEVGRFGKGSLQKSSIERIYVDKGM